MDILYYKTVAKGSILRGESTDIYTQPLCARLCYLNIETRRILILPEEEHLLSQEISSFSRMFTYVFVRGIIAKGQWTGNGKFIVHDKLVKFLQNVAKLSEKDALELSTLPSCFQLTWISDDSLPIIQSDNVNSSFSFSHSSRISPSAKFLISSLMYCFISPTFYVDFLFIRCI